MSQSAVPNVNLECEFRYAHIDGHTELDYIPGEDKIITVGVEGEARTWTLEDGELNDSFPVDDTIYSVVATKEHFYVAMANNCVKSFQLADGEGGRSVCRFTANATHLSMHPDRQLIAASAADFSIKLINLDDRSEKTFVGHTGPVLSVALDPLEKYIASSSCDGSVCLWSIDSKNVHYQWKNVFPHSNDFENSSTLCRLAWQPDKGDMLAVPKPDSLEIYKRGLWDKPLKKVTHPELKDISIATFSHDGELVAVASTQSIVMVWKMSDLICDNQQPLAVLYDTENIITALKFNTTNPCQFCCCDKSGNLRIVKILSLGSDNKSAISAIEPMPTSVDSSGFKPGLSQDDLENLFDDDEDDDFSFVAEQKQIKEIQTESVTTTNSNGVTVESQTKTKIEQIVSISMPESLQELPKSQSPDIEDCGLDDDYNAEFDIGAIKSQYEPIIFGDDDNKPGLSVSTAFNGNSAGHSTSLSSDFTIDGHRINGKELLSLLRQPRVTVPTRQPSFQSGSSPVHYKQRFMVWNSVGIVYGYNTDEERSIDVEFHDGSFHHSIHLTNMFNYTMADLSNACLVLASNGDDEAEDEMEHRKARLFCMMFNSWDSVKEWVVDMPKDEQIDAISTGQTFIAAATSQLFLRIWTVGGIQTSIVSLNGPAVNLSACERHLMILYHQAAHYAEQGQSIACQVLKVDHKGRTRCHPIPTPVSLALSPKSTVAWAGFTDEGTPCAMDSDGIVRVYKSHFGNGWFPICATKEHANGKSDNFFVIGLSEIQSQIRCIFCKASRFPDTVPKPTLTILPLQIPLCEMFTNKAKHEEECIRSKWLSSLLKKLSTDGYDVDTALEDADKKVINSLLKLFALAIGADRDSLAMEIASIMPNRNALEGTVRYAERQKHRSLATKLIEMIQDEEDGNASGDDEQNSDTELQELMVRKNADQMRQFMVDGNDDSSNSRMISLTKYGDESENVLLKPKSLRGGLKNDVIQAQQINDDDGNEVIEVDAVDSGNENALRPKKMDMISNKSNSKNPFKVTDQNKKSTNQRMRESALKRKQYEDEEKEQYLPDEDSRANDDQGEDDEAFEQYFESVRDQLLEDNEDEIDDEEDLLRLAKDRFTELSESEKKKFKKLATKKSAKLAAKPTKRSKQSVENEKKADEPKVNKITNFFKRN